MQRAFIFLVLVLVVPFLAPNSMGNSSLYASATTDADISVVQAQTNIDATDVFNTGKMVLDGSVKRLVILIPNEAHEPLAPPTKKIYPHSFVPEDAIISSGTEVVWFNGDQGYLHPLIMANATDKSQQIRIPETDFLKLSNPHIFDQAGRFDYTDTDTDDLFSAPGDLTSPGGNTDIATINWLNSIGEVTYGLNGTIIVANSKSNGVATEARQTVGALMAPSLDAQRVSASLVDAGFEVDSMHNFQDTAKRGYEHTLIIWKANGVGLSKIQSTLQDISKTLLYE